MSKSLTKYRAEFHKSKFNHKRKNEIDKYDYVKHPKVLGYRGIHDVYEYVSRSKKGERYNGLMMELQYRTLPQHAWATSVELITQFTGYEPKFNRGDARHVEFFKVASEMIARTCEGMKSCFPDLSDGDLVRRFEEIDGEIHLMVLLRRTYPTGEQSAPGESELVLQIGQNGLTIHQFGTKREATGAYFRLEKEFPKDDVVLVSADTFDFIRSAYRNYFQDVREFVRIVDEACRALKG